MYFMDITNGISECRCRTKWYILSIGVVPSVILIIHVSYLFILDLLVFFGEWWEGPENRRMCISNGFCEGFGFKPMSR